jgi:hypothetical protein
MMPDMKGDSLLDRVPTPVVLIFVAVSEFLAAHAISSDVSDFKMETEIKRVVAIAIAIVLSLVFAVTAEADASTGKHLLMVRDLRSWSYALVTCFRLQPRDADISRYRSQYQSGRGGHFSSRSLPF